MRGEQASRLRRSRPRSCGFGACRRLATPSCGYHWRLPAGGPGDHGGGAAAGTAATEAVHSRAPSAELHRLRVRIKKLRYASEFFGSLWPGHRIRKYLSSLKDLQQALGTYHDTTMATNLLANLRGTGGNDIRLAIDRINGWLSNELQRQHEEVIALWSQFTRRTQKLHLRRRPDFLEKVDVVVLEGAAIC